jgi:hypothetical protein
MKEITMKEVIKTLEGMKEIAFSFIAWSAIVFVSLILFVIGSATTFWVFTFVSKGGLALVTLAFSFLAAAVFMYAGVSVTKAILQWRENHKAKTSDYVRSLGSEES